jgi:uncharacterized protein YjbJ (UPF0337 family)
VFDFLPAHPFSKTTGQFHSLKGNAVEAVGNLTGAQSWQQSGKEEHAAGETEYNAARAKGYAEGTKDQAGGYKDSVVGAVTGDKTQQAAGKYLVCFPYFGHSYNFLSGNVRKEQGEAQQDINRKA